MTFEKLLAGRVFKNHNISRLYNNLLQVCPSVPSFVYAASYIPSLTVDRLFLFSHTDKFCDTAPLQPKATKEVSRKVVHTGELRSDKQESYVDVFLPFGLHRMRV